MAVDISALSWMQIETFFERNAPVTQKQCNDKAESISGKSVTPTACQSGTSYTVDAGQVIVQFHPPSSPMDMNFINCIEQAYPDFTPRHKDCGSFHTLHVYTMNNVGGICMYLAQAYLHRNNYELLQNTIDSYARFNWLLVLNHTDLIENNIHRDAEVSPFCMSLGGLETLLEIRTMNEHGWTYFPNHRELRGQFWTTFYHCLGVISQAQQQCIEVARLTGLFLENGFILDKHGNMKPATEESLDLRYLGAVVLV
ncbi:hypothetical protein F5Y19DRAFT_486490 [Xylariaceae sp. FL1651]|nr:hypothetical protein F5Y19DRAFT_486490 [Xylariaceae sp. FL1651]